MIGLPVWLLAFLLYLSFNLGYCGAKIEEQLLRYPRWKPDGWLGWLAIGFILISPIPAFFTLFTIWDRIVPSSLSIWRSQKRHA